MVTTMKLNKKFIMTMINVHSTIMNPYMYVETGSALGPCWTYGDEIDNLGFQIEMQSHYCRFQQYFVCYDEYPMKASILTLYEN